MSVKVIFRAMRLNQWIKNCLIFAPWFASGTGLLSNVDDLVLGFLSFSLVSSSIYILNDLFDVEEDRRHPIKSQRPVAAGLLPSKRAIVIVLLLLSSGVLVALFMLTVESLTVLLIYFCTSMLYVLVMRNVFLLDLFFLSSGFVMRVLFGGTISKTPISAWLLIIIGSFAFFVVLGKRYS